MEKHLIMMSVWTRVEPVASDVQKAVIHAAETRCTLALLGPKGTCRQLIGIAVDRFTLDNYMAAAQAGLLYTAYDDDARKAFSPGLDAGTGLPVLLEGYDVAFAKRSKEGIGAPKSEAVQQTLM